MKIAKQETELQATRDTLAKRRAVMDRLAGGDWTALEAFELAPKDKGGEKDGKDGKDAGARKGE